MEVVLRCEIYVQVDALTVVDFTMLYVVWLSFHCWCHALFVIIVSRFIVGYKFINNSRESKRKETRDEINLRTDLFSSCTQVLRAFFSRNSFQQQFKG